MKKIRLNGRGKRILRALKRLVIVTVCCISIGVIVTKATEIVISSKHDEIKGNYVSTEMVNVYCLDDSLKTVSEDATRAVLQRLPEKISEKIERNWMLIFTEGLPREIESDQILPASCTSGICDYHVDVKKRVAWIFPSDKQLFKESLAYAVGAILSHELGNVSGNNKSIELHKTYRGVYVEADHKNVNAYNTTSYKTFFELITKEYICFPEYLKENCAEAYDYIENLLYERGFLPFRKAYRNAISIKNIIKQYYSYENPVKLLENVQENELIDLNNYPKTINYSGLGEDARFLAENLVMAMSNPYEYEQNEHVYTRNGNVIVKRLCDDPDEVYDELCYFYRMYWGDLSLNLARIVNNPADDPRLLGLSVSLDRIDGLKQKKDKYDKMMETALEGMYEGSETQKLLQIYAYIADNCEYNLDAPPNIGTFWDNGQGKCSTYAIVFKRFAERIGIHCDYVCGYTLDGVPHAWNRVMLSDGTYKYYDVTNEYYYAAINADFLSYPQSEIRN